MDCININSPFAIMDFSNLVLDYLSSNIKDHEELIILCIGTDRSTGDSLGPLVGYKLYPYIAYYEKVHLLGTLEEPVHAKNLEIIIDKIDNMYPKAFTLAIDASLGHINKVGYINIKEGPLKPGLGVNKKLPFIGDISITGVVNVGGMMEYMVLQNTRLNLVMNMADIISKSISRALYKIYNNLDEKTK
jgi:putative sporulation protein YyaC